MTSELCPISKKITIIPVDIEDINGNVSTYDEESLLEYLKTNDICPINKILFKNYSLIDVDKIPMEKLIGSKSYSFPSLNNNEKSIRQYVLRYNLSLFNKIWKLYPDLHEKIRIEYPWILCGNVAEQDAHILIKEQRHIYENCKNFRLSSNVYKFSNISRFIESKSISSVEIQYLYFHNKNSIEKLSLAVENIKHRSPNNNEDGTFKLLGKEHKFGRYIIKPDDSPKSISVYVANQLLLSDSPHIGNQKVVTLGIHEQIRFNGSIVPTSLCSIKNIREFMEGIENIDEQLLLEYYDSYCNGKMFLTKLLESLSGKKCEKIDNSVEKYYLIEIGNGYTEECILETLNDIVQYL
jgi:hypothetical protein